MLLRRVIPCLDVKDGRVVKGVRFVDLSDEGDPPELAARYAAAGADEICFLDITAAPEGRGTLLDVVERTASRVFVPLTVGGGVRSALEMRDVLRAGADKVAVNTAAVRDPALISTCARRFGSQCVVISVDVRARPGSPGSWEVVVQGGRTATGLDGLAWIERAVELGAGEVLLTSIDRDGTRQGFDIELLRAVTVARARARHRLRRRRVAGRHGGRRDAGPCRCRPGSVHLPPRHPLHRRGQGRDGGRRRAGPHHGGDRLMTAPTARPVDPSAVRYGPDGLVAAVVQDADDGRVLMVAWQDAEAVEATLRTGEAHFHSRSRGRLWRKGE